MLTRAEELILLAVSRLQEKAYSVEIRKDLQEVTGRFCSFFSPRHRAPHNRA